VKDHQRQTTQLYSLIAEKSHRAPTIDGQMIDEQPSPRDGHRLREHPQD
jgi:hypothetical protein